MNRNRVKKDVHASRDTQKNNGLSGENLSEKEMPEKSFAVLGESWEPQDEEETKEASRAIEKLSAYRYFDMDKVARSLSFPVGTAKRAKKMLARGDIRVTDMSTGTERRTGQICAQIHAEGEADGKKFEIMITFSRDRALYSQCMCPSCIKNYSWYTGRANCAYVYALLETVRTQLITQVRADATDRNGLRMMDSIRSKRVNRTIAAAESKEQSMTLSPRLLRSGDELELAFRVGTDRLYVVKHLDEFCDNVREGATAVYGKATRLNHSLSNFTEEGKQWIRFLNRIVQEEKRLDERLVERGYYGAARRSGIGSGVMLFGWRLDTFYDMLKNAPIEYEDKTSKNRRKMTIHAGAGTPKISMKIREKKLKESSEFHGILVEGKIPELFEGSEAAYYIDGETLCKTKADFLSRMEPFADMAEDSKFSFTVGRSRLSEFYNHVLPGLEDLADVEVNEEDDRKFRSYVLAEPRFVFYLDVENQVLFCRTAAQYAGKEYTIADVFLEDGEPEMFRDVQREDEISYMLSEWFVGYEISRDAFYCEGEDSIYRFVREGLPLLQETGEVQCTQAFRNLQVSRKMKVSVGVSVSEGLLDLKISTAGVPEEELLDILASYRKKKNYHRLRDGSFVNLDEEQIRMLAELTETLQVKPRELIKGKMHIPLYRALYLDKMLEDHDEIYETRNTRFRSLVRDFKTVNEADFEEPESLSAIMRNYQKTGYKWLRTLEMWKFGGILADDMGLGKTLQVIAVLLAAKEEREAAAHGQKQAKQAKQSNTAAASISLVVSPAALVYNWEEEFSRFAPQLDVRTVTGTQAERRRILENSAGADVLITSYDLLKRDAALYEDMHFRYQIIDEAQYIKNHTTAAAKTVKIIKSEVRFALTGTPIENRLSELWSIFDYLMPGFLYNYETFRREFEIPVVKNEDQEALRRLQRMTAPFILRRLKQDVLKDLPEKLEENRVVKMEGEQQKLYDAQVIKIRTTLSAKSDEEFGADRFQVLAELTKLRQICCDPALCFENYHGGAAKADACIQLISSAIDGGHRILLFSQFTSMLDILKKRLDKEKIAYYTITGATPKKERTELVKKFNEGDVPLFLISLKAGGVGLNLTGADVVIHYDPWWNLAAQNQATDRAHRIGQTKKVTVYKLIVKNSIEEKIQAVQEKKKNLSEQVISAGEGQLFAMGKEDFLALLG